MLSGAEIKPSSGNKPKQLIIFLHGLGADGNDLINLAEDFSEVLPDAHFVSPNAPYQCDMSPFGYQWFSLMSRDPSDMLEGARDAEPILNEFIDAKLEECELEEKDLVLIGFSQGTMMSLHTALRRPKPIRGILGYSGALLDSETLPNEIQSKLPICLIHGNADEVVSFEALGDAVSRLKELGLTPESHERQRLGHGIDGGGVEIGKNFLKKIFTK